MRTRTAGIVLLATALLLAGCTAEPQPAPSEPSVPAPSASPTGAPDATGAAPPASAAPLVVPEPVEGEVGRTVYTVEGPDGVPESRTEILAVPAAGVAYSAEGMCVAAQPRARFGFEVTTAGEDDSGRVLLSVDDVCRGVGLLQSSVVLDAVPVQISLTSTDGISDAWVRVFPTDAP